jgi:Copper amine oxidase N-terminal domain
MLIHQRHIKFGLLGLCILFSSVAAWGQGIAVQLDGRPLQFDQPPAMVGGRLMVPLRGIFEALKTDVVYDGPTRSIQATKGSRVVQLQLGSRTAIIDGRTIFLDVPADTIGGRTMVPLRFVSEALGADVKWEGATKTVKLSSTGGDVTDTTPPPDNTQTTNPSATGPRIDRVFHSGTTAKNAGDTLDIIVYGEPGGKASFEILGSTQQIGLPEVSSGKYQTRWTIPHGLQVEKGVLLAHLEKNGRETATEADRQLTVLGSQQNNPNPAPSDWRESPASGSTTNSLRPQIRLSFPTTVQANTVRFFVDSVDFSNQVQLNGNQLLWQPTYDLSSVSHKAEVSAIDNQGQRVDYSWVFRIDPNAGTNPGQGFLVQEVRPNDGATVDARSQIGVLFNQNIRSVSFSVDGLQISNQAGVQRLANGILWTPNYDLSPGQHSAIIKAVDNNGQVLNRTWNFVVGNTSISRFNISPTSASAGEQVTVDIVGPAGASGTFVVGQVGNLPLREISPGRYQGIYTVRTQDQGSAAVSAQLTTSSGQLLRANANSALTFVVTNQLTVSNLSDGIRISPVFNVQGTAAPGSQVTVTVEYSSNNLLGALAGIVNRFQARGLVSGQGFYDVPIDASAIRPGQQFQITVSDGRSPSVQLTMTRQ